MTQPLPTNANPNAVAMLEGLRSFIINNPKAQSAIAGLGYGASGYLAGNTINALLPEENHIDPLAVATGAGVYGGLKGRAMVRNLANKVPAESIPYPGAMRQGSNPMANSMIPPLA